MPLRRDCIPHAVGTGSVLPTCARTALAKAGALGPSGTSAALTECRRCPDQTPQTLWPCTHTRVTAASVHAVTSIAAFPWSTASKQLPMRSCRHVHASVHACMQGSRPAHI
eukprot:359619-Chlamydomonas_euryale.AAC.6